jgi:hypothetical protein
MVGVTHNYYYYSILKRHERDKLKTLLLSLNYTTTIHTLCIEHMYMKLRFQQRGLLLGEEGDGDAIRVCDAARTAELGLQELFGLAICDCQLRNGGREEFAQGILGARHGRVFIIAKQRSKGHQLEYCHAAEVLNAGIYGIRGNGLGTSPSVWYNPHSVGQ